MKVKFGFTKKGNPTIQIKVNDNIVIDNLAIDKCGEVEDNSADMQIVEFAADIVNEVQGSHTISVFLQNSGKSHDETAVQLRWIELNNVDLYYFNPVLILYVPMDYHYDTVLYPNTKEVTIHNKPMRAIASEYANFLNTVDGSIELVIDTPIYSWLLANNFGKLSRNLITNFT